MGKRLAHWQFSKLVKRRLMAALLKDAKNDDDGVKEGGRVVRKEEESYRNKRFRCAILQQLTCAELRLKKKNKKRCKSNDLLCDWKKQR